MIQKEDGLSLEDFGDEIDALDRDMSIFFTIARSLMQKSGCLMSQKLETKEEMNEVLTKYEQEHEKIDFFVHNIHSFQEVWKTLINNRDAKMFLEGYHLTLFYPVTYITEERVTIMNSLLR
jgi:hypothetical protein